MSKDKALKNRVDKMRGKEKRTLKDMFDPGMYSDKRMKKWTSHRERKWKQLDKNSN